MRLPIRADSLSGLILTASRLLGGDQAAWLGVTLQGPTLSGSTVPSGAH